MLGSAAIKARSKTRLACVAVGTLPSTNELLTARALTQFKSGGDDCSSPAKLCSVSCASRSEFSARSLYRPNQKRFSAARLVTGCLRLVPTGWATTEEAASSGPAAFACGATVNGSGSNGANASSGRRLALCVAAAITQTSALLPPYCMEAMLSSLPARRAKPPGSTRHEPCPLGSANTRSMTERGAMRLLCQTGVCESGT